MSVYFDLIKGIYKKYGLIKTLVFCVLLLLILLFTLFVLINVLLPFTYVAV
jgi:hypothetical protein